MLFNEISPKDKIQICEFKQPARPAGVFSATDIARKSTANFFYCCTVHSYIRTVHSSIDAHLLKLGLEFTLKLVGSYMFRSTTIIRVLAIEPG